MIALTHETSTLVRGANVKNRTIQKALGYLSNRSLCQTDPDRLWKWNFYTRSRNGAPAQKVWSFLLIAFCGEFKAPYIGSFSASQLHFLWSHIRSVLGLKASCDVPSSVPFIVLLLLDSPAMEIIHWLQPFAGRRWASERGLHPVTQNYNNMPISSSSNILKESGGRPSIPRNLYELFDAALKVSSEIQWHAYTSIFRSLPLQGFCPEYAIGIYQVFA